MDQDSGILLIIFTLSEISLVLKEPLLYCHGVVLAYSRGIAGWAAFSELFLLAEYFVLVFEKELYLALRRVVSPMALFKAVSTSKRFCFYGVTITFPRGLCRRRI